MPSLLCFGAALSVWACSTNTGQPRIGVSVFKSEIALAPLLPAGATAVGIAVSPDGTRYVLDKNSGLYSVTAEQAVLAFSTENLASRYSVDANLDFTDVAALEGTRFAVTAENDGFLLDLAGPSFTRYFCYLPTPDSYDPPPSRELSLSEMLQEDGIPAKQRTESVAFNRESRQLFVQPRTIRLDTNQIAGSELFIFAEQGGEPIQTRAMVDPNFVAGGMVTVDGQLLLLGVGNQIFEMAVDSELTLRHVLPPEVSIAGMALEADSDLLVLDASGPRLIELAAY